MAVVYASGPKSQRMQVVADRIDSLTIEAASGSPAAGSLVIGTSSLSGATGVLVTFPLPTPGFTESGGVLTLQGTPLSAVASGSGTAAKAELRNNAGGVIASGLTVGTSGADINLGSVAITSGITVIVTAGTLTHG